MGGQSKRQENLKKKVSSSWEPLTFLSSVDSPDKSVWLTLKGIT